MNISYAPNEILARTFDSRRCIEAELQHKSTILIKICIFLLRVGHWEYSCKKVKDHKIQKIFHCTKILNGLNRFSILEAKETASIEKLFPPTFPQIKK